MSFTIILGSYLNIYLDLLNLTFVTLPCLKQADSYFEQTIVTLPLAVKLIPLFFTASENLLLEMSM